MRKSNALLTTLALLGSIGCSAGPRYKRPGVPLATQFTAPATNASTDVKAQPAGLEFWRTFHDPELTSFVEQALVSNNDLRSALGHYDAAAAIWRLSKFDKYPTVTASEDRRLESIRTGWSLNDVQVVALLLVMEIKWLNSS